MPSALKLSKALGDLSHADLLAISRRALEVGGQESFSVAMKEAGCDPSEPPKKRKRREQREKQNMERRGCDLAKYAKRDVALWLSYDGDAYSGFAEQTEDVERRGGPSIESKVFEALKKCCLLEDRDTCNYSRCGRTDKGVSALGQVLGLRLRSQCKIEEADEDGLAPTVAHSGDLLASGKTEHDFALMLNRTLPDDIRIVAWAPTIPGFSARFSAGARVYRYFFLGAGYDIEKMTEAADLLLGEHDFRNFCKMDVLHVKNFMRKILNVSITRSGGEVYCFEIRGQAFLWHMVRCIVAVLFLVGRGHEQPDVVSGLFDVGENGRRPQYILAPENALVLHDCEFNTLKSTPLPESLVKITEHYEAMHAHAAVMLARHRNALQRAMSLKVRKADFVRYAESRNVDLPEALVLAANTSEEEILWEDAIKAMRVGYTRHKAATHTLLLDRHGGQTYEEKIDQLNVRKKIIYDKAEERRAEGVVEFHKDMRSRG